MLANGSKPVATPPIRGKWKGCFNYDPACRPGLHGKTSCFTVLFKDEEEGGYFSGNVTDAGLHSYYAEGRRTGERIFFTMEECSGSFSAIFKGNWDSHTRQFVGSWKTALTQNGNIQFRGDWTMEPAEAFSLLKEGDKKCFPVHYKANDLREIYFGVDTKNNLTGADNKSLLTLSILFLSLFSLGALLFPASSVFIKFLASCFACGWFISSLLVISSLISIRRLKNKIEASIKRACLEPSFNVELNNEYMEIGYSSGTIVRKWNDCTGYAIHDSFIALEILDSNYIFPRASMQPGHFTEMKECLGQIFSAK